MAHAFTCHQLREVIKELTHAIERQMPARGLSDHERKLIRDRVVRSVRVVVVSKLCLAKAGLREQIEYNKCVGVLKNMTEFGATRTIPLERLVARFNTTGQPAIERIGGPTVRARAENSASSSARRALGKSVIASKLVARRATTQRRICPARIFGCPRSASHATSSPCDRARIGRRATASGVGTVARAMGAASAAVMAAF